MTTGNAVDFIILHEGRAQLIADGDLPDETPYQRNQREKAFPFEQISASVFGVELYTENASQEIDKVRILNVMAGREENLDDRAVLHRIENCDPDNELYKIDMQNFVRADLSLRSEFAVNAFSIALSIEGQSLTNLYGYDLVDIVAQDETRKSLVFDDLTSMDRVNDDVVGQITSLLGKHIELFDLNISGCKHLTDRCIHEMILPESLTTLKLDLGFTDFITEDGIEALAKKIPSTVKVLSLDLTPRFDGAGVFLQDRTTRQLEALADALPPGLEEFTLVIRMQDGDAAVDEAALVKLIQSLPSGLKRLTLIITTMGGSSHISFQPMLYICQHRSSI